MTYTALKFAYKHPTFGRSKAEKSQERFKNSVYYLWWEFLRRSEAYKKCCESGGKGKLMKIYQEFGDVFATDFKTWWQTNERGSNLFAEHLPPKFQPIKVIPDESIMNQVMLLQVPMALPKRLLMSEFQNLLNNIKQILENNIKQILDIDTKIINGYLNGGRKKFGGNILYGLPYSLFW